MILSNNSFVNRENSKLRSEQNKHFIKLQTRAVKWLIEQQQAQSQEKDDRINNKNQDLLNKQKQIQELFENIMDQEMKDMMNELNEKMEDIHKEELKNLIDYGEMGSTYFLISMLKGGLI